MTQIAEPQPTPTLPSNEPGKETPVQPAAPAAAAQPDAVSPSKGERPDWLPEQFWDADGGAIKGADLKTQFDELSAFKASQDSKLAAVPEKPDGYELKLPADLKFADGEGFEIDPEDPMVAFGRDVAHAAGLDQTGFEKLVGMYAQREVARAKAEQAAFAQQLEALGPKGADRQKAVTTWIAAKLGPDAVTVLDHITKFKVGVETLEKVMRIAGSGGTAPFSQAGRDGGKNEMSEEEYQKLSPAQRLSYARAANAKG